ncbi:GntR family transcriptional regulator [Thioclava sp. BHET1]|nr:GntR family transcriptional regulator [Thioclava sp. BHET1]
MPSDDERDVMPAPSPRAAAESVAAVLRARIIKGSLAPGARIVERKLSAELDVSRTPVREALKLLQLDGLVDISRNSGARVMQYSPDQLIALFEVIAALESLAAQRFAARITPEELDDLEELHDTMLAYYKIGNTEDYFECNSAIHDAVIAGSYNPIIHEAHQRLIARTRQGRFTAIMDPQRWAQSVAEHEGLMEALRNRDGEAAGAIWRTHLLNTGKSSAQVLRNSAS